MQFKFLADYPEHVDTVVDWWYTAWADRLGEDRERVCRQLRESLGRQDLPIHILAMSGSTPLGSAALKLQELGDLFPDKQYWLGSVFVDPAYRGDGIASSLTMKIVELAQERRLPHLYLQTVNLSGGLYTKLGWEAQQQFDYRGEATLLMLRQLT